MCSYGNSKGSDCIVRILHGQLWQKWGITTWAAMTGLGKYYMGAYGLIGEILHGKLWPHWGNTAWVPMA